MRLEDGSLPMQRAHGLVLNGSEWVVGGLQGLFRGKAGAWEKLDDRAVRKMVTSGSEAWVLFGDGSIDKLDLATNRLYYDVLAGAVKRPWTSSISPGSGGLIFGGYGGWIKKDAKGVSERYLAELKDEIVTDVAEWKGAIWLGTHRRGMFRISGKKIERFGFARGLLDPWVTGLMVHRGSLYVGTATAGVYRLVDRKLAKVEVPVETPRFMSVFGNRLVIGGTLGTWAEGESGWQKLFDEECAFLHVIGGRLYAGTPASVRVFR